MQPLFDTQNVLSFELSETLKKNRESGRGKRHIAVRVSICVTYSHTLITSPTGSCGFPVNKNMATAHTNIWTLYSVSVPVSFTAVRKWSWVIVKVSMSTNKLVCVGLPHKWAIHCKRHFFLDKPLKHSRDSFTSFLQEEAADLSVYSLKFKLNKLYTGVFVEIIALVSFLLWKSENDDWNT